MRNVEYHSKDLKILLKRQKIASLVELKKALKTETTMTVFRKLREVSYCTSYSHRGGYYTLEEIAKFDERGLWSYKDVHFSRYGTLKQTVIEFVTHSEIGYNSQELQEILKVKVKEPLVELFRQQKIEREKWGKVYVYFSVEPKKKKRQKLLRREKEINSICNFPDREVRTASIRFFSLLDERLRRMYAGLEAMKLDYGGDKAVSELFDLDIHTIAKGKEELTCDKYEMKQIRATGGGRKAVKKKSNNHGNVGTVIEE